VIQAMEEIIGIMRVNPREQRVHRDSQRDRI
jgi:hypothetical protein